MTSTNEILKSDTSGRVRTPADRREALLNEFERSGLTGQKFAELVGVKYQTFASWKQKRRRNRRGPLPAAAAMPAISETKPVRWVEAVAANVNEPEGIRVDLPGGARMWIVTEGQMALAVRLLRELAGLERSC